MPTSILSIPVSELRPGDLVDLEGDPIADGPCCGDPDCRDNRINLHQHEYSEVDEVVPETPDCTVVYFTNDDAYGFPPDHLANRVLP